MQIEECRHLNYVCSYLKFGRLIPCPLAEIGPITRIRFPWLYRLPPCLEYYPVLESCTDLHYSQSQCTTISMNNNWSVDHNKVGCEARLRLVVVQLWCRLTDWKAPRQKQGRSSLIRSSGVCLSIHSADQYTTHIHKWIRFVRSRKG